jgi:hypothetical protein
VHIFMCPKKQSQKENPQFCPRSWLTHMSSQFFVSLSLCLQHLSTLNFLASWGRVENQVNSGWKCSTFQSVSYIFLRHTMRKNFISFGVKNLAERLLLSMPPYRRQNFTLFRNIRNGRDVHHEWGEASTRRRILLIFVGTILWYFSSLWFSFKF